FGTRVQRLANCGASPGQWRSTGDPGGAGQSGQRRVRTGGAEHEPDVWPAGIGRAGSRRGPALMAVRRRGLTGNLARRLRVQARVDRRRGKQPYRRLIFLITLVLGAALGSALYEAAQHWWKGPAPMTLEEADDLRRQVDSFRQENEQLRNHLMATESRLILERAAKDSLEEEMRSAQRELGDLRDNLTFFEQLIP